MENNDFFKKSVCDRCGSVLTARIQSIFNRDVLCPNCKEKETKHPFYKTAKDVEGKYAVYGSKDYDPDYPGAYEMTAAEILSITSLNKKEELKQLLEVDISKMTSNEIYNSLSEVQKDEIYRRIWFDRVCKDISSRKPNLSETEVSNGANRYVYDGEYDCNLSYWDNIDNLY